MHQKKSFYIFLFAALFGIFPAFASIQIGLKMTNSKTHNYWLLTPAPDLEFSGRWLSLSIDGIIGTYIPPADAAGFVMFSKFSAVPMVQLRIKRMFISAGFGFSNIFRREELHGTDGNLSITSGQIQRGEFRTHLGFRIPLKPNLSLVLKTGYSYIDKQYQSMSGGMNVEFILFPSAVNGMSPILKTAAVGNEKPKKSVVQPLPVTVHPDFSRVCIVENQDKVVNELNEAIEVALIQAGVQVMSWKKILLAANPNGTVAVSTSSNSNETDKTTAGMEIALQNYKPLGITTAIETSLRYTFKAYGGDVLVQSAYVRMVDLLTGNLLWGTDFKMQDASLLRCKQKLAEQTVAAIKQLK